MARFLVKASEFKNVCKAVNDRKLAELKKEIVEILKKQDEKEVKKAIDYFNSQELHYTHLEKSLNGKWIEKAGYGVGTVRIWKGKKYKKIAPGKWARVFEKEGRGTNVAIGRLIAQVGKIDNIEDLMAFVQSNKQRFVDENGVDLPVLDKLRAAVDARNGNVGSKGTSKPKETDKWTELQEEFKEEIRIGKRSNTKELKEDVQEWKNMIASGYYKDDHLEHLKKIVQIGEEEISRREKPSEKKKTFKQEMNELYDAQDKAYEGFESGSEIKSTPENSKKFYDRVKKFVEENNIKLTEKHRAEIEDQNGHSFNEALALAGAYGEDAKKKELARNKEYSQKYKGQILDLSMIDEFKESDDENKTYWIQDNHGNRLTNEDAKSRIIDNNMQIFKLNGSNEPRKDMKIRELKNENEYLMDRLNPEDKAEVEIPDYASKLNSDESRKLTEELERLQEGGESEAEKHQNRSEAMKGNKNAVKVGGEKDVIGTFTKSDDGSVEMPANKEVKELFDSLNSSRSKEDIREAMKDAYYNDGNIVASDTRRLVCIKVGDIGIENGFVKVDAENGKIKISPMPDKTKEYQFPNYKRVISKAEDNNQEVKLDNKALKDKLKEMKKEGAYTKDKPFITLEFEDGKILLDGTVVGTGNVDFGDEEKFINFNAQYLTDASLSGDNASMFISDDPNKAVSISTNNSDTVIMPVMQNEGKMDYSENRAAKEKEKSEKAEKLSKNRERNESLIKESIKDIDGQVERVYSHVDNKISSFSDEELKRNYDILNLNMDKIMDRSVDFPSKVVDKKTKASFATAYAYSKLKEKHPDVKDKFLAELEKRGISVKKSLFDDLFEIDIIAADELEDEEELEENETEYNDYTAEQPELFNSPEFAVREALNRRFNCR